MTRNIGTIDRIIRILAGLALGIVFYTADLQGWLEALVLIGSIVMLATGLIGWCGLYSVLGFNTRNKAEKKAG